ncbi:MAG: DNA polymerase-3 subunit alpha [Hyphomicrobiaceae bacterium]|jgi:DNA polymerase-3 subunit alpha
MSYVHLHLHTHYSLLDGANKISELMPKLAAMNAPAAAMTDHGNMFGVVDFYKSATAAGVQPIIGCEVYVAPRSRKERGKVTAEDHERAGNNHLILLAQNMTGYRNLSRLVSQSYIDGFYYKPRIDKEILEEWNEGLLCLSGCLSGEVATAIMADRIEKARESIDWYRSVFGDRYYFEIQDNHLAEQQKVNDVLIPLSEELSVPLVATNDCHYLEHEDHVAHEVLLCVQTGKSINDPDRWKFGTDQLFVKTADDMRQAFPDSPEAVAHTLEIAKRCDLELEFGKLKFPVYKPPAERQELAAMGTDELFAKMTYEGLEDRFAAMRASGQTFDEQLYRDRVKAEIEMIGQMKFPGYFLIVQDFINWAKGVGIPVGPGRGSAAGSLVSYALRITDIDPIPYNLLFERFLNPERVSMPDIDVDFCYERREEVLAYVREKYGEDKVAHIITFGTMKGKAALRDVGRVLDFTFGETDRICKLYPEAKQGVDVPLKKALEMEPKLREIRDSGERETKLFQYAIKLEGLARHVSKHAAGIVISDRPLVDDVPLFVDKDGSVMTQFAGPEVEAIGLIKFDFLGLKTLTLIADTVRRIKERHDVEVDLPTLPLDDPAPYQLMTRADTVGIFQMESGGMQKLLSRMKPTTFDDVIAVLALYRPGPLESGMVDDYIKRKNGTERVRYDHADLEPYLRDTYGVIVYQEQVMQIAQVYAGFTLGDADNLRRIMGKKKADAMAKERERFVAGAAKLGRNAKEAEALFDSISKFAAYGFNKSHSAAYALITFQTAWLKAHYPTEFLAALLTLEMGSTDNTYKNLADCHRRSISVLPPDVNSSNKNFTVTDEGIRFGLGAVKGVGEKAIEAIVEAREEGPFRSLGDFCMRASGGQVTRRVAESLVKSGAFLSVFENRAAIIAGLDDALGWASSVSADRAAGQMGLFGGAGPNDESHPEPELPDVINWDMLVELDHERDVLGFYISGHPLDRYELDLALLNSSTTNAAHRTSASSKVRLAGVANSVKRKSSKKGDRYATFHLEDREGLVEVIAWPETYRKCESAILGRTPILVSGAVEFGEGGPTRGGGDDSDAPDLSRRAQIIASEVITLADARRREARSMELRMVSGNNGVDQVEKLRRTLARHPGECRTWLRVVIPGATETLIELPAELGVDPCDTTLAAAEALLGPGNVSLHTATVPIP